MKVKNKNNTVQEERLRLCVYWLTLNKQYKLKDNNKIILLLETEALNEIYERYGAIKIKLTKQIEKQLDLLVSWSFQRKL